MLIGHYIARLTEKGRTALPAKFRKQVGINIIIAKWYEGCLVIVGNEHWGNVLKRLTGKSEIITAPVRDTDRFILGSAFEIDLDAQGRFVIPKTLRNYANLYEEVVFVGLGDRIEVWDKSAWDKRQEFIKEHAEELVERLAKEKD